MDLSSAIHNAERPKLSITDKIDEDECSITDLGDALLGLILSFLPTKDAVKTSVLAKIWQHQWMSISNLEFREEAQDDRALFVNFVERVLLLRESSAITKFFLECGVRYDSSRISSWVSTAVKHKVQELDLRFREIREPLVLPRCVFTCKSLLQLKIGKLNEIYDLRVPSSVGFSSLKILTLRRVRFPDDYSAKTLLSGCPVLEELNLIACCWDNVKAVCISGSKLKKLTIKEMCIDNGICYYDSGETQFVICGAKLEYFCYSGSLNHDFGFSHSSSVVNVSIQSELREWSFHYRAFKLLMGLSYTKSLHVCLCVLVQVLFISRELFSELPVFSHLTNLTTHWSIRFYNDLGSRGGLLAILNNSPCLKSLQLKGEYLESSYDHEAYDWNLDPVPACFSTHLKTIEISMIYGHKTELYGIKMLLKNATVLKKMTISFDPVGFIAPHFLKRKLEICERILSFPRGSTSCIIETYFPAITEVRTSYGLYGVKIFAKEVDGIGRGF